MTLHPHFSLRKPTVSALWGILQAQRFLTLCGAPSSGKSTLGFLLASWISETTNLNTDVMFLPCGDIQALPEHSDYVSIFRSIGVPKDFASATNSRVLILDDAHNLHSFYNFWAGFCDQLYKSQTFPGLHVVLICDHSAPKLEHTQNTLEYLVSIQPLIDSGVGLYFSREEFDDVIDRISQPGIYKSLSLSPSAKDYIYALTSGHPSATLALLETLRSSPQFESSLESGDPILDSQLQAWITSGRFAHCPAIIDLFPPSSIKEMANLSGLPALGSLLAYGSTKDDEVVLTPSYFRGLIDLVPLPGEDSGMFVLPSRLHRRVYEQHFVAQQLSKCAYEESSADPAIGMPHTPLHLLLKALPFLTPKGGVEMGVAGLVGERTCAQRVYASIWEGLGGRCVVEWDAVPRKDGNILWCPGKGWGLGVRDAGGGRKGEFKGGGESGELGMGIMCNDSHDGRVVERELDHEDMVEGLGAGEGVEGLINGARAQMMEGPGKMVMDGTRKERKVGDSSTDDTRELLWVTLFDFRPPCAAIPGLSIIPGDLGGWELWDSGLRVGGGLQN